MDSISSSHYDYMHLISQEEFEILQQRKDDDDSTRQIKDSVTGGIKESQVNNIEVSEGGTIVIHEHGVESSPPSRLISSAPSTSLTDRNASSSSSGLSSSKDKTKPRNVIGGPLPSSVKKKKAKTPSPRGKYKREWTMNEAADSDASFYSPTYSKRGKAIIRDRLEKLEGKRKTKEKDDNDDNAQVEDKRNKKKFDYLPPQEPLIPMEVDDNGETAEKENIRGNPLEAMDVDDIPRKQKRKKKTTDVETEFAPREHKVHIKGESSNDFPLTPTRQQKKRNGEDMEIDIELPQSRRLSSMEIINDLIKKRGEKRRNMRDALLEKRFKKPKATPFEPLDEIGEMDDTPINPPRSGKRKQTMDDAKDTKMKLDLKRKGMWEVPSNVKIKFNDDDNNDNRPKLKLRNINDLLATESNQQSSGKKDSWHVPVPPRIRVRNINELVSNTQQPLKRKRDWHLPVEPKIRLKDIKELLPSPSAKHSSKRKSTWHIPSTKKQALDINEYWLPLPTVRKRKNESSDDDDDTQKKKRSNRYEDEDDLWIPTNRLLRKRNKRFPLDDFESTISFKDEKPMKLDVLSDEDIEMW